VNKRKHPRIKMERLSVEVADGKGFFEGRVSDICRLGLCITDLPNNLDGDVEFLTIVVSGKGQNQLMNVIPKWYSEGTETKTLGVEIAIVPNGWDKFVKNSEPVSRSGLWGRYLMKPI